jgi:alcohol dehydrogenase
MYPPRAPARLMQLAAAGLLDLGAVDVAEYPLDELPAAMDAAAVPGGSLVVVVPAAGS